MATRSSTSGVDNGDPPGSGVDRRWALRRVGVALFLTVVAALDFWSLQVPDLPPAPTLAAGVGAGAALGIGLAAVDDPFESFRAGLVAFLAVIVGAVLVGSFLLPDGLPVVAEVGVVATVWAGVLAEIGLARRGSAAGS